MRGGFFARYLAAADESTETGYLTYLRQTTLFAVPFHAGHLALAGAPAPILEDVSSTLGAGGDFAFAQSGPFVYFSQKTANSGWPISWIESRKNSQPTDLLPPGQYLGPRFSPDGKRLVFSVNNGRGADIWVKDLDRPTPSKLSFLPGLNSFPVWTPDGKYIVFRSTNPAAPGWSGGTLGWIERGKVSDRRQRFRGSKFVFTGWKAPRCLLHWGQRQLRHFHPACPIDSGPGALGFRLGKPELFLRTPFDERNPAFSPEGRWLAYSSNESGTLEVYVRPFPGPGGQSQISGGGGHFPVWSRDGRELLFLTRDQRVMSVSYAAKGDSFLVGQPRLWTETRLRSVSTVSNYDLAPDGKHLAALVADNPNGEKPVTHLTFLLNFFDELRRRASVGR